jgi:hypothetical protein
MPAPRVTGDRPRGFLAELQELLGELQVRRGRVVELLEDPACSGENGETGRILLEKVEGDIRGIERRIRQEKRRVLRRHYPGDHFHVLRLDREIAALRLQVCASARGQRGRSAHRPRRVRAGRSSHGPPGRQDDDPPEPDLACPRCGSGVVIFRGIATCGPCWAAAVLALEDAA